MNFILFSLLLGASQPLNAIPLNCYDGDTCKLDIVYPTIYGVDWVWRDQSVRLCGINAPELSGVTKANGILSRNELWNKLHSAKVIQVIHANSTAGTARRDKYGRFLVWLLADGVNVNEWMVSAGLAVSYLADECK